MRLRIAMLIGCFVLAQEPIHPLPNRIDYDVAKAELGKRLFFDPILSADNTISCASCHILYEGGDDGLRVSIGIKGQKGLLNAPTVFNAAFNFRQFWDGRAKDLQEQAAGPIENPIEMGNTFSKLILTLKRHTYYAQHFKRLYSDGITKENITDAIAQYEKTLITPDAPFDLYLKGEKNAISVQAKQGYVLFKTKGCVVCHNGVNVGGNIFNKFGIYKEANTTHLGRYLVTGREEDKGVFKVPSLRNVEYTAPYMHDGRFESLEKAVDFMADYQLGKHLDKKERDAIVAFLKSLSAPLPVKVKGTQ